MGNQMQLFMLASFCYHSARDTSRLDHVTWNSICVLLAAQPPEDMALHRNYDTYCSNVLEKAQWFQLCRW